MGVWQLVNARSMCVQSDLFGLGSAFTDALLTPSGSPQLPRPYKRKPLSRKVPGLLSFLAARHAIVSDRRERSMRG